MNTQVDWSKLGKRLINISIVTAVILLLSVSSASSVLADGNNELNESFSFSVHGDVVSAGIGLRGTGTGIIQIAGIPSGATVERAFLYWATIGDSTDYEVTLDEEPVVEELIGTTGNTCWFSGDYDNFVFRADVTGLIPDPGNGMYTIDGLPDDLDSGNDSQGASLVIVYSHPSAELRMVIINDGAVSLKEERPSYTHFIDGFEITGSSNNAHITYIIGDGQADLTSGAVLYNGGLIDTDIFDGTDGAYWDTYTREVSSRTDESPANTTVNYDNPNDFESPDCLLWAGTIFSVAQENELTEFNRLFLHGDVTASGVGMRGTGEGDIQILGIPDDASIAKAYLYWATIGSSNAFDSLTIDEVNVEGEHIATSPDTCWTGGNNNFVYRADVSDLIPGNGTYTIGGLPDDLLGSGNDSQGASLVVIYGGAITDFPLNTIIINDGAVTLNYDNNIYTDSFSGYAMDDPTSNASVTYIVGDGQSEFIDDEVTFNGVTIGDNVFDGNDGDYWDTLSFDVTALVDDDTSMTTIDNYVATVEDTPDCLLWTSTVFSITAPQPDYSDFIYMPFIGSDYR